MSLDRLGSISRLNDRDCLQIVSEAWGQVQRENTEQRELVTQRDWDNWVRFDRQQTAALTQVIQNFNGMSMSADDRRDIEWLGRTISNTVRKNKTKLIEEKKIREEAEIRRQLDAESKELLEFADKLRNDEINKSAEEVKREAEVELKSFKDKLFGFFRK